MDKTIQAIAHLFTKVLPVLDKSGHGWWRLIAIGMVGSGCYVLAVRIDYNAELERQHQQPTGMKKPADDCGVKDGQFVDRDGSCW